MKKSFLIICSLIWNLQGFSQDFEDLETFIEKAQQERSVPAVAVCITQGDSVIYLKGFGVNRMGSSDKTDENTIFQLASVTKTFTAAALGLQVDKKSLDWDDQVILHFPQFILKEPYSTRFATPRDLLAHRTGLPAFGGDLLSKLGFSAEEIVDRIRYIKPETSFRNKAYYSNVGFFLAGQLLQTLAKTSYEDVVRKDLLQPLGMKRSGFAENLFKSNIAYAYARIDGNVQEIAAEREIGFNAAAGISSTASDMAAWMIMLLNNGSYGGKQILQPKTVAEIFAPSMVAQVDFSEAPPIDVNSGFSYGLGWNCYNYQGKRIIEKGGALSGVRTLVTLIPELKMGITVLCNLNLTMLPEAIRAKFLEINVGKSNQDLQKEIREKEQALSTILLVAPPKEPRPMGHKLNQYTGDFESPLYGVFRILQEDEHLIVRTGSETWTGSLIPWSNDTFLLEWPIINYGQQKVTFVMGPDDRAIGFQTETLGVFSKQTKE